MTSFWVIEHLDIAEYFCSGFLSGDEYLFSDAFPFQRFKKAFCDGIVIAVAPSAHTGNDIVLSKQALPFIGTEL